MDMEKTGGIFFSDILPFFKNRIIFIPVRGTGHPFIFLYAKVQKAQKLILFLFFTGIDTNTPEILVFD
jgi:hypothetical protein